MIFTIFLIFALTISVRGSSFDIKRYLHTPGIHFEKVGYSKIYNFELQLLTYLDVSSIKDRLDFILSANAKTTKLCEPQEVKVLCSNFKIIMSQSLPIIQSQVEEIFSLVGFEPKNRAKRAWFDIIGKGAKVLFGTLDSDDAKYYSEKIAKFERNDKTLTELIRGQSKIVKSTINNFNSTIQILNENEQTLLKNIEKIGKIMNDFEHHLMVGDFHIALQEHLIFFEFLYLEFRMKLNSISQACILAQKGIIHSTIITPKRIMEQFRTFNAEIPSGVTFPMPMNKQNSLNLIKIIKVNIVFAKGYLIYVLNLPLPESMEFETFQIRPFPTLLSENNYIFIQPAFKYLAIDRNRIHYITFDENQRSKCENLAEEISLCKQQTPVLMTHMQSNCELKLFLKETASLELCDKRVILLQNGHFTQLTKSNTWLFTLPKPEVLTISCRNGNSPEDISLSGVGSITLAEGCKAFSSTVILIPSGTKSRNITTEILPQLNLSENCCETVLKNDGKVLVDLEEKLKKISPHIQDLNIASYSLDHITKLANDLDKEATRENFINTHSYLTYSICTIILLYIFYRTSKYLKTTFFSEQEKKTEIELKTRNIKRKLPNSSQLENIAVF
jgi:Baculovirus F protein